MVYIGVLRCDRYVVTEHQREMCTSLLSMAVYRIRITSGFMHRSLDRCELRSVYWACPACSAWTELTRTEMRTDVEGEGDMGSVDVDTRAKCDRI